MFYHLGCLLFLVILHPVEESRVEFEERTQSGRIVSHRIEVHGHLGRYHRQLLSLVADNVLYHCHFPPHLLFECDAFPLHLVFKHDSFPQHLLFKCDAFVGRAVDTISKSQIEVLFKLKIPSIHLGKDCRMLSKVA
jgi:hypothetical protein